MWDSNKETVLRYVDKFQSAMRDKRAAQMRGEWRSGFETAADECLRVLAQDVANLDSKLGALTKEDQAVLLRLRNLEVMMKEQLGAPWAAPRASRDTLRSRDS